MNFQRILIVEIKMRHPLSAVSRCIHLEGSLFDYGRIRTAQGPFYGSDDRLTGLIGNMKVLRAIDFNDFDQLRLITRRTACVVVEPVQGEAGVRPPVPGWLEALRRRCDEVGALLVFDEIQTGMGRTGEMFAMCKYGVTPDIVCLAKAFGGGMPLGAFAARKQIMDSLQTNPVLGHITTFGGHPVCCAAGLAALEYLLETGTVEHIESRGALYESLLADHPQVVEIRRSGLLLAVELGSSAKMFRMMELFKEAGILSDWFLYCDTAFRISPPLTITEEEVRDSARLIRECLDRI